MTKHLKYLHVGSISYINIMAGRNPAIPVHGKNFIVSDCDLWVSGTVFKSDGTCECMM
jgi:hypothetical protein